MAESLAHFFLTNFTAHRNRNGRAYGQRRGYRMEWFTYGQVLRMVANVGGELDFQLNWQLDHYISAYTGYAHFFHGDFISASGPANDIDFVYTAMTFTF